MEWFAQNWFWVLIGIVFVGMHMFGHGGHNRTDKPGTDATDSEKSSGHRH